MRFLCDDPLNTTARVMDVARKMSLRLSRLELVERADGAGQLTLVLGDAPEWMSDLFVARLATFLDLTPETDDA